MNLSKASTAGVIEAGPHHLHSGQAEWKQHLYTHIIYDWKDKIVVPLAFNYTLITTGHQVVHVISHGGGQAPIPDYGHGPGTGLMSHDQSLSSDWSIPFGDSITQQGLQMVGNTVATIVHLQ